MLIYRFSDPGVNSDRAFLASFSWHVFSLDSYPSLADGVYHFTVKVTSLGQGKDACLVVR